MRQIYIKPKSYSEAEERRVAAIQEIGRIKFEITQLENQRKALGREVDYMNTYIKGMSTYAHD